MIKELTFKDVKKNNLNIKIGFNNYHNGAFIIKSYNDLLKKKDIITHINDIKICKKADFMDIVSKNDNLKLRIYRKQSLFSDILFFRNLKFNDYEIENFEYL